MNVNSLYRPMVIGVTSAQDLYGSLWEPYLFLPVMPQTLRLIKGLLQYADEVGLYTEDESQLDTFLEVLRSQIAAVALTQEQVCGGQLWGATFRIVNGDELESLQGEGLPEPRWEFRTVPQQSGDVALEYRTDPTP